MSCRTSSLIILASNRVPGEISGLDPRVATRFESGMTCEIDHPDFFARAAILNSLNGMYQTVSARWKLDDIEIEILVSHICTGSPVTESISTALESLREDASGKTRGFSCSEISAASASLSSGWDFQPGTCFNADMEILIGNESVSSDIIVGIVGIRSPCRFL